MYELSTDQFKTISKIVYDHARINLTDKKRALVVSRLSKRIRKLGLCGFDEYIALISDEKEGADEFSEMVNAISTNFSHFFRESYHFDFLENEILPQFSNSTIRIWSAASSTGQEIYSILLTLLEYNRLHPKKAFFELFASDISSKVLRLASNGIYNIKESEKIKQELLKRYFLKGSGQLEGTFKLKNQFIKQVKFFHLNLNAPRYNLPKMNVIFLRNAIIYFDYETKVKIIKQLHTQLADSGYLFLGHSESLSGISDDFAVVGKTIYQRIES